MVVVLLNDKPFGTAELHSEAWFLALEAQQTYFSGVNYDLTPPKGKVEVRPLLSSDDISGIKPAFRR